MCKVLRVNRSSYYAWLTAGHNCYVRANRQLDVNIKAIFSEHKSRYGAPRITKALKALNIKCGRNRIAKRMRALNIKALAKRKFRTTTDSSHKLPTFNNVLSRDFSAQGINQKWTGDVTYVATKEGWLYLAVVIDLFSRSIIGWSMSSCLKKDLVCNALTMALFRRKFPKDVIVHSDRGSQYCSYEYRRLIRQNNLIGSMSRKGNCWDNAPSESLFHTLKTELIQSRIFENREQAKQEIFNYIEGYYNKKRIHSAIDYKTPHEMECA